MLKTKFFFQNFTNFEGTTALITINSLFNWISKLITFVKESDSLTDGTDKTYNYISVGL